MCRSHLKLKGKTYWQSNITTSRNFYCQYFGQVSVSLPGLHADLADMFPCPLQLIPPPDGWGVRRPGADILPGLVELCLHGSVLAAVESPGAPVVCPGHLPASGLRRWLQAHWGHGHLPLLRLAARVPHFRWEIILTKLSNRCIQWVTWDMFDWWLMSMFPVPICICGHFAFVTFLSQGIFCKISSLWTQKFGPTAGNILVRVAQKSSKKFIVSVEGMDCPHIWQFNRGCDLLPACCSLFALNGKSV